jgi:hypothetical protein
MFEGDDQSTFDEEQPPEESSNRTFLIVAGILGGLVLLSIACLGVYALYFIPKQTAQRNASLQTTVAQNVQVNITLTALAQNEMLSQTPLATETPVATNTPPIQSQATNSPTASIMDPQTVTVIAAFTQAAAAQQTITFLPSSTALPQGGIADEVGAPGLIVMAIALVVVILLARRLRISPGTR